MPFVRTVTFIVPPERREELQPGHNLFLAAVHGIKVAAQYMSGFQRAGVWFQGQPSGSIKVVAYSQWYELDSLDKYTSLPMIRDFEKDVNTYLSEPVVEIYEVMS